MADVQFVEERRSAILNRLELHGRVSVNILSEEMGVSTVTIRQDLRALEQAGLLKRTYGGAIRRSGAQAVQELSFHARQRQNNREKRIIGEAAAKFVHPHFSIALDASTTAAALVPFLKSIDDLTIVTNSLFISQSFLDSPQIHVLMPGGALRRDAISLVGRPELLPNINLNVGFFGAVGIAESSGVSDVDAGEVLIKQAMIQHCEYSIIIADSTKWGRVAPYTVIEPRNISHVITTQKAPAKLVKYYRSLGVRVDLLPLSNE